MRCPEQSQLNSSPQGEDLRKQFERRQAEAATASSDEPTTLWSRKLETLVPWKQFPKRKPFLI